MIEINLEIIYNILIFSHSLIDNPKFLLFDF